MLKYYERYAIEVTGMDVKTDSLLDKNKSLNRKEFINSCQKFVKKKNKSLEKNILNGFYFIHFYKPFEIKKISMQLEKINY